MLFEIFKSKWFWIILVSLSLIGAVIGFTHSIQHNNKINSSEIAFCKDFRNNNFPAVIGIYNLKYRDKYINVLEDTNENQLNFPFGHIDDGQKVYLLDYTPDSVLIQVGIINKIPTLSKPSYEELWVWRKFVVKK